MKSKGQSIMMRIAAVLLLIGIAGLMFIIGRGHTILIENGPYTYEGKTYEAPYLIKVYEKGERIGKLNSKPRPERAQSKCIGQGYEFMAEVINEQNGPGKNYDIKIKIPRSCDNVIINVPAYIAGMPEEVYLKEQIIEVAPEPESSATPEGEEDISGLAP